MPSVAEFAPAVQPPLRVMGTLGGHQEPACRDLAWLALYLQAEGYCPAAVDAALSFAAVSYNVTGCESVDVDDWDAANDAMVAARRPALPICYRERKGVA